MTLGMIETAALELTRLPAVIGTVTLELTRVRVMIEMARHNINVEDALRTLERRADAAEELERAQLLKWTSEEKLLASRNEEAFEKAWQEVKDDPAVTDATDSMKQRLRKAYGSSEGKDSK